MTETRRPDTSLHVSRKRGDARRRRWQVQAVAAAHWPRPFATWRSRPCSSQDSRPPAQQASVARRRSPSPPRSPPAPPRAPPSVSRVGRPTRCPGTPSSACAGCRRRSRCRKAMQPPPGPGLCPSTRCQPANGRANRREGRTEVRRQPCQRGGRVLAEAKSILTISDRFAARTSTAGKSSHPRNHRRRRAKAVLRLSPAAKEVAEKFVARGQRETRQGPHRYSAPVPLARRAGELRTGSAAAGGYLRSARAFALGRTRRSAGPR